MSTNEDTDVVGAANNNHQHRLYRVLCERFSPEGASHIASADLRLKGEDVKPEEIAAWDKVTRLNYANKMDLAIAGAVATASVNAFTDAVMGRGQNTPALAARPEPGTAVAEEEEWGEDDDETEDEEEQGPADFGYDNEEDNAEAALDYIYKLNDM